MKRFFALFQHPSPAEFDLKLLDDARYAMAEHKAAAEYHYAMIGLYSLRIARLEASQKGAA